ncbi:MAG: hypothetical protein QOH68_635, partial [Nocardioidaceae bacterium]|nr:hypothetical protein [Nocardioidaceae bacterium]
LERLGAAGEIEGAAIDYADAASDPGRIRSG